MPGMEEVASMWEGGLNEHPAEWLSGRGWHVRTYDRLTLARSYGRPIADATGGFVTAVRA